MTDEVETQQPDDDWAAALQEQAETEAADDTDNTKNQVQQAAMENLVDDAGSNGDSRVELDAILDIPVSLSVRIGKTRLNIRNLLQLNQGSVVELDRLAGEPLDVLVNDTLVAHGEVVVVNEKYGIRLTDIVSAHERVKQLQ
jgi:flagellar motor switch protein FliN/FliY